MKDQQISQQEEAEVCPWVKQMQLYHPGQTEPEFSSKLF